MATIANVQVKVPCRLSYVFLTESRLNEKSGKDEYSVVCLVPKTDTETIGKLRSAMKQVCINRWGEDSKNWPKDFRSKDFFETYLSKNNKDGFFLCNGDLSDAEEKQGHIFFTARDAAKAPKTPKQPQCAKRLDEKKWKRLEGAEIDTIYSGCFAEVGIDVFSYETKNGDKGISCSLKAVMFVKDGDRLSGSAPVNISEFFGGEEAEEEFMGGDDDLNV